MCKICFRISSDSVPIKMVLMCLKQSERIAVRENDSRVIILPYLRAVFCRFECIVRVSEGITQKSNHDLDIEKIKILRNNCRNHEVLFTENFQDNFISQT